MHYCLETHHIRPREFMSMDMWEKASILASGRVHDKKMKDWERKNRNK